VIYSLATERPRGLTVEIKSGWAMGRLTQNTDFIHCSSVGWPDILANGITPFKSREWLVDDQNNPISGGRMVFAFPWDGRAKPPKAAQRFGMAKFMYVFRAPSGTFFYCQSGTLANGKETALPYVIEHTDIHTKYRYNDQTRAFDLF